MVADDSLRTVPFGVYQKYLLVTSNYVARDLGVRKMTKVAEALKICPHLRLICGEDLTPYRAASEAIFEIVSRWASRVERLGLEEFFLDVSDLVRQRLTAASSSPLEWQAHVVGSARSACTIGPSCDCVDRLRVGAQLAKEIREEIEERTGMQTCGGVAWNKLMAKLVSGRHKPNDQTAVVPSATELVLADLRARDIIGVGHSTARRLRDELQVETREELLSLSRACLVEKFGVVVGDRLFELARGVDTEEVTPAAPPKQLSVEDSFRQCFNYKNAEARLAQLTQHLWQRISVEYHRHRERIPRTLRLSLRHARPLEHVAKGSTAHYHSRRTSKSSPLPRTVVTGGETGAALLYSMSVRLLRQLIVREPFHITLLNVAVCNFDQVMSTRSDITAFFATTKKTESFDGEDQGESYDEGSEEDERGEEEEEDDVEGTDVFECPVCHERLPLFCAEAHSLFHEEALQGEVAEKRH